MSERVVWKFPLKVGENRVRVPGDNRPVHFATQNGQPCMWAEVDPGSRMLLERFEVIGTGWKVPEGAEHAGTLQAGPYVWHLYHWPEGL